VAYVKQMRFVCRLENPCVKNTNNSKCAPPFGFRHQQKISENLTNFKISVENTKISGNIDSPEGSFDALMQIAVCTVSHGFRVRLFAYDADDV